MSSRVTPGRCADRGVDVAGHGDVDDQQRSIRGVRPRPARCRRPRAAGSAAPVDESSTSTSASASVRSASGTARPPHASGQLDGGVPACGWRSASFGAGLGQAEGHRLAHLAGAEHEPACGRASPPRRSAAMATAAWDTDVMSRAMPVSVRARLPASRAWRNSRLSAGPAVALLPGPLPGRLHLAEDLALAEHGGVEPGGHLEEVGDGGGVVVDVEVVAEVLGGQEGDLGEEVADVLVGAVEPLGDGVDLGAVARGQHDRLGHVVAGDEVVQRLGQPRRRRWSSARAGRAGWSGGSDR